MEKREGRKLDESEAGTDEKKKKRRTADPTK
jgi:hypothetical protein